MENQKKGGNDETVIICKKQKLNFVDISCVCVNLQNLYSFFKLISYPCYPLNLWQENHCDSRLH